MINNSTKNKLIEMRLSAMADAFILQESDPSMKDISFDDRFGMLVDSIYKAHSVSILFLKYYEIRFLS